MPVSNTYWQTLNNGWPEGMEIPTDAECINGVKRMWRHIHGTPLKSPVFVVRHRGRRTWSGRNPSRKIPRSKRRWGLVVSPMYERPAQGWPAIVHDLSHYFHQRLHPDAPPHDSRQARLEKQLQQFVIDRLI